MMNMDNDIGALLFDHDCIIIPDFGGFVCNYASAAVHIGKHRFRPPYKKISFNRSLKNNDGLLANQIAQSQKISYSDSLLLITSFVEKLNKDLISNKRLDFKHIGTIYLGEENNLLFNQDETVNYLPEAFGLSTFNSAAIRRESIERKTENSFKDKVIIPSQHTTSSTKRKSSPYLLGAVSVLILMFLLWVPFQSGIITHADYSDLNPFASKEQPMYHPSEINIFAINSIANKTKSDSNLFATANNKSGYVHSLIAGKLPVVVRINSIAGSISKTQQGISSLNYHFHIVGGAFGIPENAEKLYRKLMDAGYPARIIDKNNLRMVSYAEFETKAKAVEALARIRAVQQDAWLMAD